MERDRRGYRLSVGGCLLTLVAFVLAITATISNNWATFIGKSRLPSCCLANNIMKRLFRPKSSHKQAKNE